MDYWIKLYTEILDNPKMGLLPDRLWRRVIELFLLAGKLCPDKSGILPDTKQIAWLLRLPVEELEQDLNNLLSTGIIQKTDDGWVVVNFKSRQERSTATERVRRYRENVRRKHYYSEESVTPGNDDVTQDETQMKQNVTCDVTQDETQMKQNVTCDVTQDVTQVKQNVTQINRLTETESESESETESETESESETELTTTTAVAEISANEKTAKTANGSAVFSEYESNFGMLTSGIADHLSSLLEDYPEEWILHAMKEALAHEARNLKYVEAILRRWKREGFRAGKKGAEPKKEPKKEAKKYTPEELARELTKKEEQNAK